MDGKNYTDVTRSWYGKHTVFPLSLVVLSQLHRRAHQSVLAGLPVDTLLEQRGIEVVNSGRADNKKPIAVFESNR